MQYLNNASITNKRCPECRCEIKSTENLTAIVSNKNEEDKNEIINSERPSIPFVKRISNWLLSHW